MDIILKEESVKQLIRNQQLLQSYVPCNRGLSTDKLLKRFSTAIFVECGEAISETNFKWWKAVKIDMDKLVGELADIFIFALDFHLLVNGKQKVIGDLLEPRNVFVSIPINDYELLVERLKIIGSVNYAEDYKSRYGIAVMESILEIAVVHGFMDFIGVVLAKQQVNVDRQLAGYNKFKENR